MVNVAQMPLFSPSALKATSGDARQSSSSVAGRSGNEREGGRGEAPCFSPVADKRFHDPVAVPVPKSKRPTALVEAVLAYVRFSAPVCPINLSPSQRHRPGRLTYRQGEPDRGSPTGATLASP